MPQFRPQVTYMTLTSRLEYERGKYGVRTPYETKAFKTYAELKKALRDYILHNHIGERPVIVTRSRRGEWGEWFEHWEIVNGEAKITKKGWQ